MGHHSNESRVLGQLVERLHSAGDLDASAVLVVTAAKEHLDCDYASVVVRRGRGTLETLAATDDVVEKGDNLQCELREGPCVDAISARRDLAANDVASDARWPRWGPQAASIGLVSLLVVRMVATQGDFGCLNLYSATRRRFTAEEIDRAHQFAEEATVGLSHVRHVAQLKAAVEGRTVIGQAQGILMERFGLSADQAFAVLRRCSQHRNVKLHAVADDLVSTGNLSFPEHTV